jgi:hypothetical protein
MPLTPVVAVPKMSLTSVALRKVRGSRDSRRGRGDDQDAVRADAVRAADAGARRGAGREDRMNSSPDVTWYAGNVWT